MRVLFAGRFNEAEALMERNRELGLRAQTPDITYAGARVLQLFVLRREPGRLREVEAPLARYVEDYPELVRFGDAAQGAFDWAATVRMRPPRRDAGVPESGYRDSALARRRHADRSVELHGYEQ
jgi:hypothetical protein